MKLIKFLKTLKTKNQPLKYLLAIFFIKSKLCNFLTIKMNSYKLFFSPSSLSLALWLNPNDRKDDDYFFQSYLEKNDNVIDVGANIGSLTLLAASIVKNNGKIFSIEPHPKIFIYLKENIALNPFKNIRIFNNSVGDVEKVSYFSNLKSDDQNATLMTNDGLEIIQKTIDQLIPNDIHINLMKIDVEGYEKFVLLGSEKILKNTDCVYFEAVSKQYEKYGYNFKEVYKILLNLDFKIYKLCEKHFSQITPDYVPIQENLIAVKDESNFIHRTGFKIHS